MIDSATELVVAADDRTGALEAAGACVDAGLGPVPVGRGADRGLTDGGARCIVIDLGSRHLSSAAAAACAAEFEGRASGTDLARHAHKIDSTLRGNWASELVARQVASRQPVLVVPALPAMGRCCVDGIVLEHGRPVHDGPAGRDHRAPARSSRPAEHLRAAGAAAVAELEGAAALGAWLAAPDPPFAVCDAASDADLAAVGLAWRTRADGLLAGTSAAIGAAAAAIGACGAGLDGGSLAPSPPPHDEPILVVCGSLHPTARSQLDALADAGVTVVALGQPLGPLVDRLAAGGPAALVSPNSFMSAESVSGLQVRGPERGWAAAVADALAGAVRLVRRDVDVGTLVLIGGDTAAAVLGDGPMVVGGTVAVGMPWSRRLDGGGPLVLSRAGGFGGTSDLLGLVVGRPVR